MFYEQRVGMLILMLEGDQSDSCVVLLQRAILYNTVVGQPIIDLSLGKISLILGKSNFRHIGGVKRT